jgi:Raf kinase inhibitor-like YbhB/YbcL family protein
LDRATLCGSTALFQTALCACNPHKLVEGAAGGEKERATAARISRRLLMTLLLTSALFADGEMLPTRSSCDGEGLSPHLVWTGVPAGAAELALTVLDPDAPGGTFVHWLLWGLSPVTHELEEGMVPECAHQGTNGFGRRGYGGPCPPRGDRPHRYVFRLSAVSSPLVLPDGASIDELDAALNGNVVESAQLIGRYAR